MPCVRSAKTEDRMSEIRRIVTFKCSAFNTTKEKEKFINPNNYGDDVAEWFAVELEKLGAKVDREDDFPGQEDFGWYIDFTLGEKPFTLVVGSRPDEGDKFEWVLWIERQCGFLGSIFGGRDKNIAPESIQAIHKILSGRNDVSEIRWHLKADFDKGIENTTTERP